MWEPHVNAVLAAHSSTRVNGGVASEQTQDVTKEYVYNFFNTLWKLGYKVQKPENVGERHVEAVVRYWWNERKVSPKTMQNYLSRIRIFFGWVGKPGLVGKASKYLPEVPAAAFIVRTVAAVSKAWTSRGVDVSEKIAQAFALDLRLGLMLLMQLAFGLRRKEVILCRPWVADRGTVLRVYPGEAKGSRPRDIPIETEFQREVLKRVQQHIGKTKALGWEFMADGSHASHKQRLDRYKNYMQSLGITKAGLGVTGHGLRAQFAENKAIIDQFIPATLGGEKSTMPLDDLQVRRLQVSEALGHSRDSVTGAYYGKKPRAMWENDRERFQKVVAEGLEHLQAAGYVSPPPVDRIAICVGLVEMALFDDIQLFPAQAHALWKKFSERFGVDWVKPETGIREALEVAARQAIVDAGS